MADTKISNLTQLAEAPASTDELVLVDKSDTAMAASGTDKRITFANLSAAQNVDLTFGDAINVVLNASTGTKIGTATTQKLGFFNATPVVQQTSTVDLRTALINLGFVATGGANPLNLNGGALTTTGVATIGDLAASTKQLEVKGSASGGPLITLTRTTGATIAFSWSLVGGGLAFSDDTNSATVANMFGASSINALYIGQKGKVASDTRTHLISGTTFGTAAGSDVAGQKLQIQGGLGNGAGTPGDLEFLTGTTLASGTTGQTGAARVTIKGNSGLIQLAEGIDLAAGTTTGTKIGTGTTQKLGFFNVTPVVQPSAFTQTYATATKVVAALLGALVTDNFGTADGVIADVGTSFNQTTLNNNFRDLTSAVNLVYLDMVGVKSNLNSVIDDLQALGLLS